MSPLLPTTISAVAAAGFENTAVSGNKTGLFFAENVMYPQTAGGTTASVSSVNNNATAMKRKYE